jgi:hypothetical protein
MPGQRRDVLLTKIELERLANRDSDETTKKANDARVRKKLAAWLKNIDHIILILDNLPEDQIREVSADDDIYKLLFAASKLLNFKKFYPVKGNNEVPAEWYVVDGEGRKIRNVSDEDIRRADALGKALNRLNNYYKTGPDNPVYMSRFYDEWKNHPAFEGRINKRTLAGIKRVNEATGNLDTFFPQPRSPTDDPSAE